MSAHSKAISDAIDRAMAIALPEITDIDWDAALTGDVGLDSVQIMNLVMEIEDDLDISIPVDRLADVQTLNQLARQIVIVCNEADR
jgi:acyl carrier protein